MATQKVFIIDTHDGISDGIAQTPDKQNIGRAYQQEAPDGHFITIKLEGHWIVTEEDYKLISKIKRENAKIKTTN